MASQARKSKVLRIAIIQDRKIKQERLIKAGDPVTIGESPKNTFVVSKNSVTGASFTLFEAASNGGYTLRFTERFGEKSKVSTGGLAAKLHSLVNDSSVTRQGDMCLLQLTPQDRGKLELDDVFVLFQFVAPPPQKAVKPIKAMDFRPRLLEDDDPVFLGFLAIWSALALVLTIWVWNSDLPVYTVDDIPDRFVKLEVKEPPPPPEPLEIETDQEDPNKTVEKATEEAGQKQPEKDQSEGQKAKSQQDRKNELEQTSKLLAKIIGTTGESSGDVVADLWSDEDKGLADIDKALSERGGGVTTDANDPSVRNAGGGTGEAVGIGDLSRRGGGESGVGTGPAIKVATVGLGTGTVSEEIGDAGKVKNTIRRYSGQMKYCYEQQLKKNQDLEGRVELGWAVYEKKVESVYVISNNTGDEELASCMVNKLKRWEFEAGIDGDVSWPFIFKAQN